MGKISNEDRDVNDLKLLAIWQSSLLGVGEYEGIWEDAGWMYFSEIAKGASSSQKKTISRYLSRLVKEGKLEFQKEGYKTRRFRPAMWYWRKTFKWMRVDNLIEKEHLDAADAEYLYFIGLASRISETFDKACLLDIDFQQRKSCGDGKGPSRKQLNKLNAKIAVLIRAIRLDLSKEYFCQETKPEVVYGLLRDNVQRAVKAYLDLWLFINQTYGAREAFAKQMLSVQRRVAKLKREH